MPIKLSETPFAGHWDQLNPAQAREQLKALEDPESFDQKDPALKAWKKWLGEVAASAR